MDNEEKRFERLSAKVNRLERRLQQTEGQLIEAVARLKEEYGIELEDLDATIAAKEKELEKLTRRFSKGLKEFEDEYETKIAEQEDY